LKQLPVNPTSRACINNPTSGAGHKWVDFLFFLSGALFLIDFKRLLPVENEKESFLE